MCCVYRQVVLVILCEDALCEYCLIRLSAGGHYVLSSEQTYPSTLGAWVGMDDTVGLCGGVVAALGLHLNTTPSTTPQQCTVQ